MKTKKTTESIWYRIILIPPKKLSNIAASLASKYAVLDEVYYKVDDNYLTHLTVYYGEFSKENEQKVFKTVNDVSKKFSGINIEFKNVELDENWLWLRFKYDGEIRKIHRELLLSLSILGKVHIYNTRGNYRPHISLLRYKNEKVDISSMTKKLKININKLNYKWPYLAIAQGEEHGIVSKVLKKYKLK